MEDDHDNHNLMSEKQAAARLGISRITLLRAREAGRIRFFRIGTRVLYNQEQLNDFLATCERKGAKLAGQRTPEHGRAITKIA
jgi:excisionase family DNA binding protein